MAEQTPSQTVGPFFHYGLIHGGENILVNDLTKGQRIRITGTVFDGDGHVVEDAMVEIWQPDSQGIFNHPADAKHEQADPQFKGFGRSDTSNSGMYMFKTVKPGRIASHDVPGQAPYINVRVFSRGMLIHAVTRLYFSDENNRTDPVLTSVEKARQATLIAQREETEDLPTYRFDIQLQGEGETVFFNP